MPTALLRPICESRRGTMVVFYFAAVFCNTARLVHAWHTGDCFVDGTDGDIHLHPDFSDELAAHVVRGALHQCYVLCHIRPFVDLLLLRVLNTRPLFGA